VILHGSERDARVLGPAIERVVVRPLQQVEEHRQVVGAVRADIVLPAAVGVHMAAGERERVLLVRRPVRALQLVRPDRDLEPRRAVGEAAVTVNGG
jgi:hypothetical protein